ncbi:hypothetical protein PUN28_018775 [Cardiocondyla obscurior]
MLAAFVVFNFATIRADIPSYIRACGRKNPNYDQCIINNLNNVRDHLCEGIPEFNLSSIEPIVIDRIAVFDAENFKLHVKNVKVTRVCDYTVQYARTDSNRLYLELEFRFNRLIVSTEYEFNAHVLVPLKNEGLLSISLDKPSARAKMNLKVVTKNGKSQIYVSKINTNIKVSSFEYKFDNDEKDQLHQILNNFVDNNKNDILTKVLPIFEKKLGEIIISIFNSVTRSNYEKLFPETA